jgi:uncharacterized protein YqjF (DUF2071 family)
VAGANGGVIATGDADSAGAFLTAEWRDLVLVNFEAPAALLAPLVPRGTKLDRHRGIAFVSLVGFRFLNTRVLGCRVPGHVDFDEVNLRFYVRRELDGEERRAVTFVKEVVPRRLIASLARAAYNEPYVALPMHSEVRTGDADASTRARYVWRSDAGEHQIEVLTAASSAFLHRDRTKRSSPSTTGVTRGSVMAARSNTASRIRRGGFARLQLRQWKATWRRSTARSGTRSSQRRRCRRISPRARR